MKIARESYALGCVCLADLISTIFFVSYRNATEGNPLMAFYLSHSLGAFVGVKLVLCLMPLFLMEYARRHRPQAARLGLRVALAGYLFSYAAGVSQLNPPDRPITRPSQPSATYSQHQQQKIVQYYRTQMVLHQSPAKTAGSLTQTAAANLPPLTD